MGTAWIARCLWVQCKVYKVIYAIDSSELIDSLSLPLSSGKTGMLQISYIKPCHLMEPRKQSFSLTMPTPWNSIPQRFEWLLLPLLEMNFEDLVLFQAGISCSLLKVSCICFTRLSIFSSDFSSFWFPICMAFRVIKTLGTFRSIYIPYNLCSFPLLHSMFRKTIYTL